MADLLLSSWMMTWLNKPAEQTRMPQLFSLRAIQWIMVSVGINRRGEDVPQLDWQMIIRVRRRPIVRDTLAFTAAESSSTTSTLPQIFFESTNPSTSPSGIPCLKLSTICPASKPLQAGWDHILPNNVVWARLCAHKVHETNVSSMAATLRANSYMALGVSTILLL